MPQTHSAVCCTSNGTMPEAAHITVRGLYKDFGGTVVYAGFDLDIPRGRFITVFGPNGCGESTLINIVAGLIPPDRGRILFGGKGLAQTKIGYVFQNYREALFPWMSAFAKIVYPLRLMRLARGERAGASKGCLRIWASASTSSSIPTRCPRRRAEALSTPARRRSKMAKAQRSSPAMDGRKQRDCDASPRPDRCPICAPGL